MLYKIFAVLTAMRFVTHGGMAQPPAWTMPANGATITLDASVNTACDNLATINADSGDGTTVSYSVSQTPLGGFSIVYDGNTGDYILKCTLATIKASSATSYSVTLRASNSGKNSDITITISVTGLSPPNANAPVFSGTPYNLKVCRDKIDCRDDIILPFVLLAVSVSDADNNTVTLSLPDADPTIFTVESYSIKVKGSLLSLPSPYQLKVVATDNGTPPKSSSATVTLTLGYAPKFTDPSKSSDVIYLCETSIGGDELIKLQASDTDTPIANLIFSMDDSPTQTKNLFEIVGDRLKVKSSVANGTFDYEKPNAVLLYTISLKVSDGTFSSILNTQIVLEDFNDNPPVFQNTPYTKSIPEATTAGSSVFQVSATDADKTSPNNVVTFILSGSNDFIINNASGVISVAAGVTLNYGTTPSYSLTVKAIDGGGIDNLTATALVTLNISTKPTFDNLASPRNVSVDENVPAGTTVFTLTVTDRDNTGPLSFFIKTQNVSGAFVLNGKVLQTATSIDKETLSSYTISFNVSDGTYSVDSAILTVNVNDVNEKPTFSSVPNIPVKLLESTVAGTQVFNVSASDPDMSAPNNVITFSLSGSGSSDFRIGASSGVVSVESGVTLNYTRQPSYQLVITAKDDGTPFLSSSSTVTVSILTKPTFDNLGSPNTASVNENVPIGSSVFTVSVSDRDNSSALNIFIKSQSVNGAFVLNGSVLQTATSIDREALSSYTISFNVTDGMFTTESANLSITVNDLNDNPPLISPLPDIIKVSKNKAEKEVYYMRANDGDATAPNNVFKYSIIDGNSDGYFSLNESSGLLQLVKLPNSAETNTQSLKVKVVDGGTPQLSSTVSVSVEFSGSLIEQKVQMILNGTCPDLTNPSEYTRIQNNIIKMLKDELKIEAVIVFNIRCGSISFDSRILTNDTKSAKTALAEGLKQIVSGMALPLGSEYVTARSITVNEKTISGNPPVCEVFIMINPCGSDHQCSYENGAASCKLVKTLNTDLIIGLCIGLILPLLAALIMIIVAVCCSRRRRRHKSKRSSSLNCSIEPRRDKFRGHRWQGDFHMPAMVGYNNHAFTNGVNGFHTRAGQSKRDYYGISSI